MVLLRCSIASECGPRKKISNERVGRFECRQLAEYGALLAHDFLEARGEPVDIGIAAVMMHCHAKLAIDRERPKRKRAELDRAVDQVLQAARGERPRIGRGMQLGRNLPPCRRVEGDARLRGFPIRGPT